MNRVNRILRLNRKPEKVATSARYLREIVNAKWGEIEITATTIRETDALVPVIFTAREWNVWKYRLTISRADLIEVDGVLRVRLAALETALIREIPAWRAQNPKRKYVNVRMQPYTLREYQRICIQYSESRKKHQGTGTGLRL